MPASAASHLPRRVTTYFNNLQPSMSFFLTILFALEIGVATIITLISIVQRSRTSRSRFTKMADSAVEPAKPAPILPPRTKIIDMVERQCDRAVVIDTSETEEVTSKCHSQEQAPIFSLPREIRDEIWAFATAQFEDADHKYEAKEYYCRPGHRARSKTYSELLLTCRRVWIEAHAMPMLQARAVYWYKRPAPDQRDPEWTARLTNSNRADFGHLHMFTQMCEIERLTKYKGRLRNYMLKTPARAGDFQPRTLHVTGEQCQSSNVW